jgi:hypothetical protein
MGVIATSGDGRLSKAIAFRIAGSRLSEALLVAMPYSKL